VSARLDAGPERGHLRQPWTRLVRAKRPGDPETQTADPVAAGVPDALGRAQADWRAVPRPAAHDSATCVSTFRPGTAIRGRRPAIIVMRGVLDPFPDIAVHVVKPESVWRKLPHRSRVIPLVASLDLALAALIRAVVGVLVACLVAPGIRWMGRIDAGDAARRVFPFRLGQQPVRLGPPAPEPGPISLRLVPWTVA